jgi:hypothetical protein
VTSSGCLGDCGRSFQKPPLTVPQATSDSAYLMLFLHCVKVQKSFEFLNLAAASARNSVQSFEAGRACETWDQRVQASGSWPLFMNSASRPSSTSA